METEKKLLAAREAERRKIAREIHDGPAQSLAAILLRLDLMTTEALSDNPEQIRKELLQIREIVQDCLNETRKILFDLKPVRENTSLLSVLEDFFADMKAKYAFSVEFSTKGIPQIYPVYMQTALFRLVQEAVNNSRKHAGVSKIQIILSESEEQLEILIEDQGSGFDTNRALMNENRFGISGMQERVDLLGGSMTIQSKPGAGTQILIGIPLKGRN